MKLSAKLAALSLAGILFTGIGISYFVYIVNVKTLEAYIEDRLKNQAFHTIDKIDMMLFERSEDIKGISSDPVMSSRRSTPKQIAGRLAMFKGTHKAYESLSFFDLNRVRIADTEGQDIGRQHSLSEYWPEISGGRDLVYNISESESLKKGVIHFAAIVKDKNGIPFGVVVSRVPLEQFHEIITRTVGIYNIGKDFRMQMVNKAGRIIYSNYYKEALLEATSPDWALISEAVKKGEKIGVLKHTHSAEKSGEEILVFAQQQGFENFKGSSWMLITEVPTRVVLAPAKEIRNWILLITLIMSFFPYAVARFFAGRITKPIEKLSTAAEEVAKGNLDIKVDVTTTDETGRLSEAFNKMTADLKEQRDELFSYGTELEAKVLEQTSALREANKLLKEREAGLTKAQEIAKLGNWEFDFATGNVTWSDEMYQIFGLHPEQFKPSYEAIVNRVYPDDREIVIKAAESAMKEYKTYARDYRIVRPDGTVRYIHSDSELIFDKNGKAGAMYGTAQDITERKHAEEKVRNSEEKLRSIFTEARDGIVLIDTESGFIIDCNPEFERQSGRRAEELKGLRIWEIRTPEKIEAARNKFFEIAASGAGGSSELEFQRPDGDIVSIEFRSKKVTMAGKEYIQSMSRDITERKKMEEENKKQMNELQRWYNAMLDREYRVIELKREVNELLGKTGQKTRYPSVET